MEKIIMIGHNENMNKGKLGVERIFSLKTNNVELENVFQFHNNFMVIKRNIEVINLHKGKE
jgi:hypothetical protein